MIGMLSGLSPIGYGPAFRALASSHLLRQKFGVNNYTLKLVSNKMTSASPKYLSQQEATAIDQELFSECQFSVDQLMELAGLSCAAAVADARPAATTPRVLVVCGPGNNGGDGLVCARHLQLFGHQPTVYYPVRRRDVALYQRLVRQCEASGIPVLEQLPSADIGGQFELLVDALFGFSYRPPVRPQFADAMRLLTDSGVPVFSVDVPSGWHVEEGPVADGPHVKPEVLVSLTAPKLCARYFSGTHYLGGRFVPPSLQQKYGLNLPSYPGTDCVVKLSR